MIYLPAVFGESGEGCTEMNRQTEIVRKRVSSKETYKTVQFSHTILEGSARQTPSEVSLELKRSFRGIRRSFLNIVSFIELDRKSEIDFSRGYGNIPRCDSIGFDG